MQVPQLHEKRPERIIDAIHLLARGRMNCHGEVTLALNTNKTRVDHPAIGKSAAILLSPRTQGAANSLQTTYVLDVEQDNGFFILSHTNSGEVGRTFRWVAIGG